MSIDKSLVKRILVITLSNVGDIILTTPVIRTLGLEFPDARIDAMVGPNGKEIFEKDPKIFKLIIYDKHLPILQKRRLQMKLRRLRYDFIVDLRNTVLPILLGPKFRTATIQRFPKDCLHSKEKHLYRLRSLGIEKIDARPYIYIAPEDEICASGLIKDTQLNDPFVLINPGAKSHLKRWTQEGFAKVADKLIKERKVEVAFIGLSNDKEIVEGIISKMDEKGHNLVGRTTLRQLAAILKKARLLITNDSAPLHLGCAVGCKVLSIFGPTSPDIYGPTGEYDIDITAKLSCSPCQKASCDHNYECMKLIDADQVFEAAKLMVEGYA